MKMFKSLCLLICIMLISCTIQKNSSSNSMIKVTLYKQATTATDADFSFDKKAFWEDNFNEHTFIYQIFAENEYQNIINKVKKFHIVAYKGPQHFTGINYAFVVERKSKKNNDTVYYDGNNNWWLTENGKEMLFEDKNEKLVQDLRRSYRIFGNCY